MSPLPHTAEAAAGRQLRVFLEGESFSCVGAKMAVERDTLVHRHYGSLASPESTPQLYRDLRDFADRREEIDLHFATFVATFDDPRDLDEHGFERMLWRQLQQLHDLDGDEPTWHPGFDSDTSSDRFGYCIGGHPFFIVGLHGQASRTSRRFAYPAMAFNSHEQFDRLHQMGVFRRLRTEIRRREVALQGSVNPSFIDYPGREARQYAGRATEADWTCPFHPRITTPLDIPLDGGGAAVQTPAGPTAGPVETRQVRSTETKLVMAWSRGMSLLDLCEDYGLPVDSLCRSGVCGRCAVPLVAGDIEYLVTPLADLPPKHVLLCVTTPATDIELRL